MPLLQKVSAGWHLSFLNDDITKLPDDDKGNIGIGLVCPSVLLLLCLSGVIPHTHTNALEEFRHFLQEHQMCMSFRFFYIQGNRLAAILLLGKYILPSVLL